MRLGLYVHAQHPPAQDAAEALEEHLEQASCAFAHGFEAVFAGQHFLSAPFWMFQPVPLLARVAAVAPAAEIGIGVFVLPLLHPLELAETIATLDVVTNGRFVVGAGLGYRREEWDAFEVGDRPGVVYERKLEALVQLLEGKTVTASGPGYRLDEARLQLQPLQKPRPPVWLAAVADSAVRLAAEVADAWLMPPMSTLSELERQQAQFLSLREAPTERVAALREVCVADTDEEAVAAARPFLEEKYAVYASWGQDARLATVWETLAADRFLVGSSETVLAGLEQHRERLGVTDLLCRIAWPGFDHRASMRTLELLAAEVLPRLNR
jgi:alkanesulfonate monooxygenase SsuD/methylene tetrahydromethanopterin reductase-like flavin-dependent oxidoreductase (luciferase family)